MKKTLFVITSFIFLFTNVSYSAEKPCSEFNKWTENYAYQKCMSKIKADSNSEGKNKGFLSNLNKKYKDTRKKVAPKTGAEIWKDFKNRPKE